MQGGRIRKIKDNPATTKILFYDVLKFKKGEKG